MAEVLDTIGDIEILIAGVGIVVFAVSYGVFFRWTKTPAGRALMYFVLSLLALVLLGWLRLLFGGEENLIRDVARVVLLGGVGFTAWRMVWVLWRNWARARSVEIELRRDGADPPDDREGGGDPERT